MLEKTEYGPFRGYYYLIYEDRENINFIGEFITEREAYSFLINNRDFLEEVFENSNVGRVTLFVREFSEFYTNIDTLKKKKKHKTIKVYVAHCA
jgi:hypothetical protein